MRGVRLKLDRANQHLLALTGEVEAFFKRDPYRVEGHSKSNGLEYVFKTKIVEHPPLRLSLIAGDAPQNMRFALDHIAWALTVRKLKGEPSNPAACSFLFV
ncbi:MAG: hypothetical protein ACR2GU_16430 [Rubrobacteraceae bacterium]